MELKDKIINYWVTLYPELNEADKIDNLLKDTIGEGIDDLLERIEKNKFYSKDSTLKMVEDIFSLPVHDQISEFEKRGKSAVTYYNFFRPIVNYCFWKYYDQVKELNDNISFDNVVMNCLEEIAKYAIKILVLDVSYMKRAGKLEGDTPEERHAYYEDVILTDKKLLKELYINYYEYVRLAMKMADACTLYLIEILKNYNKDKAALKEKLGIDEADDIDIMSIKVGSGDKHNGKSVAQILLSNKMQVLYKPHSLELDRDFHKLIEWINDNRSKKMLDLKAAECISSDSYSWAFYVPHKEVSSKEGINRYFYRAGQLLAIMHMLNGVDCHHENIIACGEYPVLIDTETLMHPIINGRENNNDRAMDVIESFARKHIFESVMSTGLLPYFITGNEEGADRVDVSGLSSIANYKYPFKSAKFVNANSDEVKIERDYQEIPDSNNCPVYKGKTYEGLQFETDIINGFSVMYDWILANRQELLKYIRTNFADTTIRILMRATNIYGRLLETSVHPDFLCDDISRRVLLSRIAINSTKEYKNIIPYECESLVENDVPYFTCQLGKENVSCNGHSIDGMIKESPIDSVIKKLSSFSEADKHQQIHYIKDSYRLKESTFDSDISDLRLVEGVTHSPINNEKAYIEFAKKVADYLLDCAVDVEVEGKNTKTWFTCSLKGKSDKLSEIGFATYNFYSGISGIGQFLLELAKLSDEEKYLLAARDCVRAIQYKTHVIENEEVLSLGSYNGVAGYLLFLYDANKTFNEPEIEADIDLLLDVIHKNLEQNIFYDIMQGDAGCMQVLNYIYRDANQYQNKTFAMLEKLVNKLKNNLYNEEDGNLMWVGCEDINKYCGYAHGSAGIIAQIARVRDLFDTETIDKMIEAALVFERSFYDKGIENWYTNLNMNEIGNGWCHGSPGILLEKCILKESGFSDDLLEHEYEIALKNTIEMAIGCTHCYCHGDIGNLDIIYYAAELSGDEALLERCVETYDKSLNENLSRLYAGKAFRAGDVVGLMLGSAGFGYSALRYANREKVKSILTF